MPILLKSDDVRSKRKAEAGEGRYGSQWVKSGVPKKVRSTSYLGFKEVKFVFSIDEVVHKFFTALFVSVIVGAYASKAKCEAIWNGTFSVGGVA